MFIKLSGQICSFLVLLLFSGCELYDLREDIMINNPASDNIEKKAREIINKSIAAHGWDSLDSAHFSVTYIDHWPNFWFRTFFHPWPDQDKKLKQTFGLSNLYDAELIFVEGVRKGEIWGLDNWKPYIRKYGEVNYRSHGDTKFYLPTYQYFFQMPYWLGQVPILRYLGKKDFNNKQYYIIYGTWKQIEPTQEYDQYLYWINTKTNFLEMVQYTIRDQMPNAHGTNTFSDFRKVGDLIVPFIQTITFEPGDKQIMHQIIVENFDYKKLN